MIDHCGSVLRTKNQLDNQRGMTRVRLIPGETPRRVPYTVLSTPSSRLTPNPLSSPVLDPPVSEPKTRVYQGVGLEVESGKEIYFPYCSRNTNRRLDLPPLDSMTPPLRSPRPRPPPLRYPVYFLSMAQGRPLWKHTHVHTQRTPGGYTYTTTYPFDV